MCWFGDLLCFQSFMQKIGILTSGCQPLAYFSVHWLFLRSGRFVPRPICSSAPIFLYPSSAFLPTSSHWYLNLNLTPLIFVHWQILKTAKSMCLCTAVNLCHMFHEILDLCRSFFTGHLNWTIVGLYSNYKELGYRMLDQFLCHCSLLFFLQE